MRRRPSPLFALLLNALAAFVACGLVAGCHDQRDSTGPRGADTDDQSWTAPDPSSGDVLSTNDASADEGSESRPDTRSNSLDAGGAVEDTTAGGSDTTTRNRDGRVRADADSNSDTDAASSSDADTRTRPELTFCLSKDVPEHNQGWWMAPYGPQVGEIATLVAEADGTTYMSKWDLDGDDVIEETGAVIDHAWSSRGRYSVTQYLLDDGCVVDKESRTVRVR